MAAPIFFVWTENFNLDVVWQLIQSQTNSLSKGWKYFLCLYRKLVKFSYIVKHLYKLWKLKKFGFSCSVLDKTKKPKIGLIMEKKYWFKQDRAMGYSPQNPLQNNLRLGKSLGMSVALRFLDIIWKNPTIVYLYVYRSITWMEIHFKDHTNRH